MVPPAGGALRARNHPTGGHQDLPPPVEAPPSRVQRIHCTPMGTATRHEVSPPVEAPQQEADTPPAHASPGSWALPQDHPLPTGGRWPFVLPCPLLWAPSSFAFALAPSCLVRSCSPIPFPLSLRVPSSLALGCLPSCVPRGRVFWAGWCSSLGVGRVPPGGVLSGWGVVGVRGVLCLRSGVVLACGVGLLRLHLL